VSVFFTGAIITVVIAAIFTFPLLYQNVFLLIPGVAKYSPGDVLNRFVLLTIILTFWWTYPRLGLSTIKFGRLTASRVKIALWAMLSGCLVISFFFFTKLLLGQGYLDPSGLIRSGLVKTLLWYLLGAITVGVVEELLFRGITLQVFLEDRRTASLAILLSALLFATVHFIDFDEVADILLDTNAVNGAIFSLTSLAKFALLTILGILLAYARQRSNSLYAAIGLHAGLVLTLRVAGKIFKANPGYSANLFQLNGVDMLIMASVLALAFKLAQLLPREPEACYNLARSSKTYLWNTYIKKR
jgi:membrane protease YdiL (CAAX protease family)